MKELHVVLHHRLFREVRQIGFVTLACDTLAQVVIFEQVAHGAGQGRGVIDRHEDA